MNQSGATTALVGATGGAGTTRLAVEFTALLTREGEAVCVLDAAYATPGLAQYVAGRIGPDVTALCVE
jgi:Flp pilus assembly CpaE family ATPase